MKNQKINLKRLGVFEIVPPNSIAVCYDFLTIWARAPDRARLLRLCAAAVAVCLEKEKLFLPYPFAKADPIAFGFAVVEKLHRAGMNTADIYENGSLCLSIIANEILAEDEVAEAANFTDQEAGPQILTG